jgi:hypothetical protein
MNTAKPAASWSFLAAMFVLGSLFITPARLPAQTINTAAKGNNAVWASTSAISGSAAFIDASVWGSTSLPDYCATLGSALSAIPSGSAAVIDARGLNSTNTSMSCASSPWNGITTPLPSTILLGPGNIIISATWVLPNQTQIMGAGRTNTTIEVANSFSPSVMIQMGSSALCPSGGCTGVGVSDLRINGQEPNSTSPTSLIGIQNENSQTGSYVSHVAFHYVEDIALDIETSGANDSGPYIDLAPSAGDEGCSDGCAPQTTTACVKIVNAQTRGVHGITCTGNAGGTASAPTGMVGGIYLDGNANTIEDGHFEGLQNAVVVGDTEPASGNLLLNLSGATGSGTEFNVVRICNSTNTSPCTTTGSVSDLAIFQVEGYTTNYNTIVDMINSTTLGNSSGDDSVGMYVLGEALKNGSTVYGYSRFSTATSIPTWDAGGTSPTIGSTCTPTGAIFSNTSGTTVGTTIIVCVGGKWAQAL